MSSIVSYNNDKAVVGEVEYPAGDPASGAFFQPDFKKNDDLKLMLDGSKDSLKLEAMKRIIGMIAKGRDASDLFPAVVKNVVSKNIEVKKLVYVYLVRYAEEQQDLALLSISTFQRALKDPNQLIRASALRVLSSIRVNMIVPIVMLAIRDSASDMSPYVRKTAAHAIPKLYSLDPEQKEELVSIIDKLLSDKAPLVVGSAAMAFSEVCPDRMSLIHRSYRKLCSLLADVDEWGQLALLNVLTVYARTCFPDPNNEEYSSDSETEKPFYESDSSEAPRPPHSPRPSRPSPAVDGDLRLLLRAARPLLQSRNAGVVTACAQLYYHCAPAQELPPVAKAMIRLLRAPLEVQSVVLNSIASLTVNKRSLFEPFLKSFFVRNSDPTHIKLLKLEIVTNLASEASAGLVLREFQTYVASSDRRFAAHTIQAIGRLALAVRAETERCLRGLLHLLSSKDEWVVCEAVVVVKRVVGGSAAPARAAVARAAKLLRADRLAPAARAAGVWLVAEHGAHHPRAAAILAHLATHFPEQDELVKLQLLSLAVKLSITQPDTVPVCRYVLALARYDSSYDVRDRARMLRRFVDPSATSQLAKYAEEIFRPDKPKPTIESTFKDRQQWTLGTLAQCVGGVTAGYRALPVPPPAPRHAALRAAPDAPAAAAPHAPDKVPPLSLPLPPASCPLRAAPDAPAAAAPHAPDKKNKDFYSEPESSGSGSGESSSGDSSSEESSDEEESSNEAEKEPEKPAKKTNNYRSSNSGTSESESDSETSASDSQTSASDSQTQSADSSADHSPEVADPTNNDKKSGRRAADTPGPDTNTNTNTKSKDKSNLELLLELDEMAATLPTLTPTCGGLLSPPDAAPPGDDEEIRCVAPRTETTPPRWELVSRVTSRGLRVEGCWARAPHLYSDKMTALHLTFTNTTNDLITDIKITKKASCAVEMRGFSPLGSLPPAAALSASLGVHYADSIQPLHATLSSSIGEVPICITPPVGELMRAVSMSEARWISERNRLRGMTECDKKTSKIEDEATICKKVLETANVAFISSTGELLRFAGRMTSSQDLVLVSVKIEGDWNCVTANCPNMAVASLLANELANNFNRA